ncbi:MAG: hemerythrin domain-containing protein [Myxococcaceae bacterium]|nr:hemerythrin domain-containing protein [Myxococcaceae bacterium]
MRERPWAAPHKALRHVLGLFQAAAGATDYGQPDEVARLKRLGGELFELLYSHARSENEHLLVALDVRAPGASQHDRAEHVDLEATLHELEARLSRLDGTQGEEEGYQLYLAFSDFHARYLAHILHEERVTQPALTAVYSDDELRAQREQTMQAVDFRIILLFLKYAVPAQPDTENVPLLTSLKAGAPVGAFEAVVGALRETMPPARLEALLARL